MNSPHPARIPAFLPAFCLHFVLPNVLLLIAAMVFGGLGSEYGITYLVWHDDPMKQFWVGFALALVTMQTLYIGFMLWAKKVGRPDRLQRFPELANRIGPSMFGRYCAWVVGQLAGIVIGVTLLVLLFQIIERNTQSRADLVASGSQGADIPPPAPRYSIWLPFGGFAACCVVFTGGWLA